MALLLGAPLMMDFLVGLQFLYVNLQTVDLGIPPRYQCLIGVVWSIGYVVGAQFAGRWCTPKNARMMMSFSLCGSGALICLVYLVQPNYTIYAVANALIGFMVGFYFTPYQVKMGHIHPFRNMAMAVAIYNISWGVGFSLGFLGAGWVMDLPGTRGIACVIVLATVASQLILLSRVDEGGVHIEKSTEEMTKNFASSAIQRRVAWLCVFVGLTIYSGFNGTLWPNLAREGGLSSLQIGISIFVMMLNVPLLALFWAALAQRIHGPILLIGLLATVGLADLAMPFVSGWPAQTAVMFTLGAAYSGIIYHALFYANADPVTRERSVGITESVIGSACVVGPTLMGWLAWDSGATRLPYFVGCCLALLACVIIAMMWLRAAPDSRTTTP